MIESHEVAGGRDVGAELLALLGPEPAERPPPQAHARAHELVRSFQAGFALEKSLRVVVIAEAGRHAVSPDDKALAFEKLLRACLRVGAAHAKVDGGFRESAIKITGREPNACRQKREADRNEAIVGRYEALFHGSGFLGRPMKADAT